MLVRDNPEATSAISWWTSRGLDGAAAQAFGIGLATDGEYAGRLSIPYLSLRGGPVAMKYRCVLGHDCKTTGHGKYGSESGFGIHLYNASVLAETPERVVICEGELDAVAVQSLTGIPAVAYPGVSTWQKMKHWPLCFDQITDVIVVGDGDEPGRAAARTVANSIPGSRAVVMPEGHDASSYLAEYGTPEFLRLVEL